MMDESVKSLDRVYDSSLTGKNAVQKIRDMMESGFLVIDTSRIIGKSKV